MRLSGVAAGWIGVVIAGGAPSAMAASGPPAESPFAAAKDPSAWSLEVGAGGKTRPDAGGAAKVSSAVVRLDAAGGSCNPAKGSVMYRRIHGIVDVLESRDVRAIGAMVLRKPVGMEPNDQAERLFTFSMCASGAEVRRVDVLVCPDGAVWSRRGAVGEGGEAGSSTALESIDRDRFMDMMGEQAWDWYGGTFEALQPAVKPGNGPAVVELSKPYLAGRYVMDQETISRRLLGGRSTKIDKADRVLEIEKLSVRLPAGYSAREPAGLLVWVDAGDDGQPPPCLFAAMDEANVIAAGFAKCGNTRPVANRYQLVLDAVATVSRRYHVDPRRVYVSGISGGGRIASIVAACFPDVFTGAVPIVGLNCSEAIPVGGGKVVPPSYVKPTGKLMELLRQRRIGAITGQKDFNQQEIVAAAQILRGVGVQAKVFDFPGMGHELPSPEGFAEAFKWVDEPYQKLRKGEIEAGERAMRAAVGTGGEFKVKNDADRAALMRVTEVAPWTPSAWRAVELLDGK
jgi:predicted esterase